jgi:hypothetical protein
MKKLILTLIVLFVLALAFGVSAFAGEIEPNFSAYLETLSDDDFASAIIYLRDRPDIKALDRTLRAERATMKVRHERVLTALKQAAERSQPALLNDLRGKKAAGTVRGYTPYWIMNLVVVSATKAELNRIAQRPEVEAIEGNFRATLIEPVYMGSPTASTGEVTKSLKAINADRVWNELGYTGAGTLVANLDTGVDGTHPALRDRWRGNTEPWQECWRDGLGRRTTFPVDRSGHGTHTMGTMCGADPATGDIVGVAYDALWIADNSIHQEVGPEFDNDVLGAFQWFADPDGDPGTTDDVPDVLQNSWGINSSAGYDYQDCDYRWQEVIENCEAAGVVVTFSAGNEGPRPQSLRSPANICNTPTVNFSVGAVDCENYGWPCPIASFSSRGPSDCDGVTIKPEVTAPGVDVYSCYLGGSYVLGTGTSMAGPHVAGVVALMRQADPDADVHTIKEILMSTARDLGRITGEDNTYGWGVIDAYAAVLALGDCDNDGNCGQGENCFSCADCKGGTPSCGNGVCEPRYGEDCRSCPSDCRGQHGGRLSKRYCCGDGDGGGLVGCEDPRCNEGGFQCGDPYCCGNGICEVGEDGYNCKIDCGAPPVCGDASCDTGEDQCNCAADCCAGASPPETACSDGCDNDCDEATDCDDEDCYGIDPACPECLPKGAPCDPADDQCCKSCHPRKLTCK